MVLLRVRRDRYPSLRLGFEGLWKCLRDSVGAFKPIGGLHSRGSFIVTFRRYHASRILTVIGVVYPGSLLWTTVMKSLCVSRSVLSLLSNVSFIFPFIA